MTTTPKKERDANALNHILPLDSHGAAIKMLLLMLINISSERSERTALFAIHGIARYRSSLNIIHVLLHFTGILPVIADIYSHSDISQRRLGDRLTIVINK